MLPSAGAVDSAAQGASAPTEGGEGRGILWRPPAYSLLLSAAKVHRRVQRAARRSGSSTRCMGLCAQKLHVCLNESANA